MVNDIIGGISKTIYSEYPIRIYAEDAPQDLSNACFFIKLLETDESSLLGTRAKREHPFDIHYFPGTGKKSEMYSVADRLLEILSQITLVNGDMINATKKRYQIIDGVLHFFVNYNLIVAAPKATGDEMDGYTATTGII